MSRRLRVFVLANSLAVGGAETQLVRVSAGLARRGHEVTVGTLLPWYEQRPALDAAGVPVEHISTTGPLAPALVLLRATRLLTRLRPDVLVSFDYQANVVGRVSGLAAGVPVVVSSIRSEHFGGARRDAVLRWSDRWCTTTVVNSRRAAEGLVRRRVLPPSRVTIIPNGLDATDVRRPASVRHRVRADLGVRADEVLWLAVGHLRPQKDYSGLLQGIAQVPRGAAGRFRLCVVGGGLSLPDLEEQARALGLGDVVRFLGARDDVPDLMAAADALVLSSRHEGMPNAVMEALAVGLPVVATTVGGVDELVSHGESGILVPVGSPNHLATAIAEVTAMSAEQRAAMGARGRNDLAASYSVELAVDRWERLLLGAAPSSAARRRPPRRTAVAAAGRRWA